MTKLKFINYFFLQLFFIRLARIVDTDTNKTVGYKILKWVVPFSGWNTNYKYIGKTK
jgi:hypothetical protein